ncbi:MAG TPA: hypothetical protein VIQ05_24495 [Tardiphaga sp.]
MTTVIAVMIGRFALLGAVLTLASLEGVLPLAVPFDVMLRSKESYFLAYPEGAEDFPALRAFREWLLRQVASGV